MDLGLGNRVCVVLASSDGLGAGVARALLEEGARVALSGRDTARLERARDELATTHGERVWAATLDVTDAAASESYLERVAAELGPVEVLVTNAGGPPPADALEATAEGFRAAHELSFESAAGAIRHVLPGMRARGWGRIVALTSLYVREPLPKLVYSNAARAGLTAYLKSLSDVVAGEGITVNSICTGMVDTARLAALFEARAHASGRSPAEERAAAEAAIPRGSVGRVEELGAVVAFLCSRQASYVTGVALPVDGGALRGLL